MRGRESERKRGSQRERKGRESGRERGSGREREGEWKRERVAE